MKICKLIKNLSFVKQYERNLHRKNSLDYEDNQVKQVSNGDGHILAKNWKLSIIGQTQACLNVGSLFLTKQIHSSIFQTLQ